MLAAAAELDGVDEIFPLSAKTGEGLEPLVERLAELVPEGPLMYPPEQRSDQPSEVMLAELIREQVLRRTRDELPHAVEVEVDEVEPRDDGLTEVTRPDLGRVRLPEGDPDRRRRLQDQGDRLRRPRTELERELGGKVFLDLKVRVRRKLAPRRGPAGPPGDRVASTCRLPIRAEFRRLGLCF